MDLFKTDLETSEIAALQKDQDRQAQQRQLAERIAQRKRQMDKQNRKAERRAKRTTDAKSILFQASTSG